MVMQNQQWATYMKICIEQKSKLGKFLMMCKGDMDLYWELLKLDGSFNLIGLYMQQLIFSILSKFIIWIVIYFNLNHYILCAYLFIRYKIVIGFILIPTLLQVKKWDLDFMKWLKLRMCPTTLERCRIDLQLEKFDKAQGLFGKEMAILTRTKKQSSNCYCYYYYRLSSSS